MPPRPLDDRDRHIVSLLQADAWLSYVELAKRVHLSASAVQRRVERLRAEGVLLGAHARVALSGAPPVQVFALIELVDDSSRTIRHFMTTLKRESALREAHYVTGEVDIVLKLDLETMAAYDLFVRTHFNASPYVKRFKTLALIRPLV